jgi:hypothetical protein
MFKNKFFIPVLLFILIIPAFYFFLKPGIYWNMHDDMQMIRQLEMEKCFQDGQIPCRWTPDLGYGYGYPLFNFYPPLPYLIGEPIRLLGLSFVSTIKLTALLQILLSAGFMYFLGLELVGPFGALLGALFYTYAPYHAVNVYVRGAMNEAWAAVFFPLIFLFSYRFVKKSRLIDLLGLAISFCLILLSHNPMAFTISPFLIIWILFWSYQQNILKFKLLLLLFLKFAIGGLLAVSLSAFFTLPLLFESHYVQIDSMFQGYYNYTVHFVSLFQLFISSVWGDGPSIWGPLDQLSFSVGYLHWILPLVGIILILYLYFRKKVHLKPFLPFFLLTFFALFSAFLTHERSSFIWRLIPILPKIQFPWRFLNLSSFFFSAAVIFIPAILLKIISSKSVRKIIYLSISVLVVLLNYQKFYPITFGPITDQQKFSGESWRLLTTASIYDYLPKTASTAAKYPAQNYLDAVNPNVKYTLNNAKKGTDWLFLNLNLSSDATVTLPVLAFPGFKLSDFGKPISYQIEPYLGRIIIPLSAGEHQLYLKLFNTPIRTISNYLSLFSWLIVISLSLYLLWIKKSISKK